MNHLANDLRHLLRSLVKQPGFTAVAAFTLALGIGANTAVFSVLNSVILAPLPYTDPGRLVRVYTMRDLFPDGRGVLSVPDARDVRDLKGAFSSVGFFDNYSPTGADLSAPGEPPRRIRTLAVSSGYFATLGATPALGRTFVPDEEREGVDRVILSHPLWRDVAGLDPAVIGRTISLNGRALEVIGVMRPSFEDLVARDVDAWVPLDLTPSGKGRWNHYLSAVARLAPGVTLAQAGARLHAMTAAQPGEYHPGEHGKDLYPAALHDDVVGSARSTVWILMGAAVLVLLIACLNVANLFLTRSLGQAHDLAVRSALGAHRGRLVAERLAESVIVALAGGLVGSAVASWGVTLLLSLSPGSLPRAESVAFDGRLLTFSVVLTVLTGLAFGAVPAWRAAQVDPAETLREGGRGRTTTRRHRRSRGSMVAAQIAVALVLLAGVGTLIRAFVGLLQTNLGFSADRVTTFTLNLPGARYTSPDARIRFHLDFMARLRQSPGVESVGATSWLPVQGDYHSWGYAYTDADGARKDVATQYRVVEGDYFATMGIPLLAGRSFDRAERQDSITDVIINQALAREAYGKRNPIGDRVRGGDRWLRVIGVVGNAALDVTGRTGAEAYLSHQQFGDDRNWPLTYVIRTAPGMTHEADQARTRLAAMDAELVLDRPGSLETTVSAHRAREQFTLLLMTVFAGVALSLAAIGLYGAMAYHVRSRTNELGIRIALGARPAQVRYSVLREAATIAGIGVAVGVAGAMGSARVVASITPTPTAGLGLVVGGAVLVMATVSLVAAYLPARRATRVSPLEVLRSD
jgi:putative ABC transport system permease protein